MLTSVFRIDVCSFVKIDAGGLKLTLFGHKSGRKGVKLTTSTKHHPDIFLHKLLRDIRSLLRRTKKQHSDAPTRGLNQRYVIPGYRFVKREGIIQLVKDNSSGDSLIHPSMQSQAHNHKVADDFDLNAKFSNFNEGEDEAEEEDTDSYTQF
jgi:hypothetical protein